MMAHNTLVLFHRRSKRSAVSLAANSVITQLQRVALFPAMKISQPAQLSFLPTSSQKLSCSLKTTYDLFQPSKLLRVLPSLPENPQKVSETCCWSSWEPAAVAFKILPRTSSKTFHGWVSQKTACRLFKMTCGLSYGLQRGNTWGDKILNFSSSPSSHPCGKWKKREAHVYRRCNQIKYQVFGAIKKHTMEHCCQSFWSFKMLWIITNMQKTFAFRQNQKIDNHNFLWHLRSSVVKSSNENTFTSCQRKSFKSIVSPQYSFH